MSRLQSRTSWHHRARLAAGCLLLAPLAACSSDNTGPATAAPDKIQLTAAQVTSLDSSGQAVVRANPGNANLQALVDSTLMVLTAGVEAQRIDITTDLTTAPLYFVGVHRTASEPSGAFSTWTLVGLDDPSHLANIVEVSGFAQTSSPIPEWWTVPPPAGVSGTIGDGSGVVNVTLLQVGAGGVVSEWYASTGSVTISSDAPGAACPNFTPTPKTTCALETMHVHFSANAPPNGSAGARQAAMPTDAAVPAMRLTYTP